MAFGSGRHSAGNTDGAGKRGVDLVVPGSEETGRGGRHRIEHGGPTVDQVNDRLWNELEDEHGRPGDRYGE